MIIRVVPLLFDISYKFKLATIKILNPVYKEDKNYILLDSNDLLLNKIYVYRA